MGMWTTDNQDTFAIVLKSFSDAARKNYGDHAFEAGYLQSMCVEMLAMLPKRVQRNYIDSMVRAAQKQEADVIRKMNENKTFERV